ncbi:MAG: hypothetical protein K1X94_30950 [Sandaracinaceae bacterium]|nr:hypothetical protein [Sandaracinaceae bacterium]
MRRALSTFAIASILSACGGPGDAPDAARPDDVGASDDVSSAIDAPASDDASSLDAALAPDAGPPADLSCNGSFTLGAVEPVAPHPFHVRSIRFPVARVSLVRVDELGIAIGDPVTTDDMGDVVLDMPGNDFASWRVTGSGCPDTCVPTYGFRVAMHGSADLTAGAVEPAIGHDIDDFVGVTSRVRMVGTTTGQAWITVRDCNTAPVAGARIEARDANGPITERCVSTGDTVSPCFVYVRSVASFVSIDPTLSRTQASGGAAVFGAASPVTITAFVTPVGATEEVQLGEATVPLFDTSSSLATIYPRGP